MFYFHDPLMNTVPSSVTPPAMSRVVEVPVSPLAPPKGWQWANAKSSSAVAPGTVASGGEEKEKKRVLSSPPTSSPKPIPMQTVPETPCSADSAPTSPAAVRAWQPPKGYTEWTRHTRTKAQPPVVVAPAALAGRQPLPAWRIVSWKNLAPRRLTGTKEEVIVQVESDLAAAGVHHLDIQIYSAVHTIVALKAKT